MSDSKILIFNHNSDQPASLEKRKIGAIVIDLAFLHCHAMIDRKNNRYFSQAGQPIESRQTALSQLTTIIPTICSGQARPDRINFLLYQSSRLTAAPPHPQVQIVCHATSCFQSNGPTYGGARHAAPGTPVDDKLPPRLLYPRDG
jgi:hypothetical protein